MTNHDELELYTHKILKMLTGGQSNQKLNDFQEKSQSKNPRGGLSEKMNQVWELTKNKIIKMITTVQNSGSSNRITLFEKEVLLELQSALNTLNNQKTDLLDQGILNLYIHLLNLREKTLQNGISITIQHIVKFIIQAMSKLVFSYFCYQQYKNKKEGQPRNRNKSICSLKNIGQSVQQKYQQEQFDHELMKSIETSMKKKSIHQIINQNMEKQMATIQKQESLCKICSQKIKLRNIQRHVKLCQKQFDYKQDCQAKKRRMSELTNGLRRNLYQINLKASKSKEDQSLKTIITSLLYIQNLRKQKGIQRRSQSLISSTNQYELQSFQFLVQQHEQQYGTHQILRQICKIQKEIVLIQRKLNGLQVAMLNVQSNVPISGQFEREVTIKSIQSNTSKSRQSLDNKPTLNCLKTSDQLTVKNGRKSGEFNISDQTLQLDQRENKQHNKSMKQWLFQQNILMKKAESKKYLKEKSNQTLAQMKKQKNFVSLQEIQLAQQNDKKISFNDFQVLKMLGKGAYGKVYMVRRKETEDLYALKMIHLSDKVTERQLSLISKQHQIYKKIAGDFLVKAAFSFTEKSSHMFVLQYMPGGDLKKILNEQVYFEQSVAKFYLAEIVLAIQHLHNFNIIHRDLKPQNLVLDKEGHLKLTDFGLSELKIQTMLKQTKKFNQNPSNIRRNSKRRAVFRHGANKTNLIGTPDYIAPEIINYVSTSNNTIDWWSLGVIAYELMIGTRPFCANTIEDVIKNIKEFNIQWPQVGDQEGMITQNAKNLIQSLLDKDFINRLGANGADEIKAHPFFSGINWEQIKCSTPPIKPNIEKSRKQIEMPQDKSLRQQIQKIIEDNKSHSKLKLDKFVRFDLLGDKTMENFQKIFNQKVSHISKLKTLQKLQKSHSFDVLYQDFQQ